MLALIFAGAGGRFLLPELTKTETRELRRRATSIRFGRIRGVRRKEKGHVTITSTTLGRVKTFSQSD